MKTHASFGSSNLNMCTVSVLLEQHKNIESILNARELIDTHRLTPRRNSKSFVPSWTLNRSYEINDQRVGRARGAHEVQQSIVVDVPEKL